MFNIILPKPCEIFAKFLLKFFQQIPFSGGISPAECRQKQTEYSGL